VLPTVMRLLVITVLPGDPGHAAAALATGVLPAPRAPVHAGTLPDAAGGDRRHHQQNWANMPASSPDRAAGAAAGCLLALLAAYRLRAVAARRRDARTIAIETSIQNGGTAMLVTGTILNNPAMTVAPIMYGILMLIPIFAYLGWRRLSAPALSRRCRQFRGPQRSSKRQLWRRSRSTVFPRSAGWVDDVVEQALEHGGVPVADRRLGVFAADDGVVDAARTPADAGTTRKVPEPAKVQACFSMTLASSGPREPGRQARRRAGPRRDAVADDVVGGALAGRSASASVRVPGDGREQGLVQAAAGASSMRPSSPGSVEPDRCSSRSRSSLPSVVEQRHQLQNAVGADARAAPSGAHGHRARSSGGFPGFQGVRRAAHRRRHRP
jgi:hypothetical protein